MLVRCSLEKFKVKCGVIQSALDIMRQELNEILLCTSPTHTPLNSSFTSSSLSLSLEQMNINAVHFFQSAISNKSSTRFRSIVHTILIDFYT